MAIKTLMLVEDDEDDRDIFLSVVQNFLPSISCFVATNGQEALDSLRSNVNLPQLIFLDLNMPLMNGRQFLDEVKRYDSLKDIPVIVLSTSSDKETIEQTKQLGAKHFITKPDRYSDWESTLQTYLTSPSLQ